MSHGHSICQQDKPGWKSQGGNGQGKAAKRRSGKGTADMGSASAPFSSRARVVTHTTVAPVMFGKPLLNNVLAFDHVLLHK